MILKRRGLGRVLGAAAALLVGLFGLVGEARAAFYAYSVQQTSGYTFTGASVGPVSPNTSSSSAQMASPTGFDSHVGTLDALEAFVGPGGKPPENTFTPKGMVDADYSRGDALLTQGPFTTNNVAELFLAGAGNAQGAGAWSASAPITLSSSGAVSLTFDFTNQLSVVNTGAPFPGTVQASYTYNFNIQDAGGTVVFSSSPTAVNRSISLISPGSTTLPGAGTVTITSGTLAAGTYTATISGSENVFASAVSPVPEPSSCVLLCLGGLSALTLARRRRARLV